MRKFIIFIIASLFLCASFASSGKKDGEAASSLGKALLFYYDNIEQGTYGPLLDAQNACSKVVDADKYRDTKSYMRDLKACKDSARF